MFIDAFTGEETGPITRAKTDRSYVVRLDHPPLDMLSGCSWRFLLQLAARRWNVDGDQLAGQSRDQLVCAARHHAMWLLRTHTRMSLPRIGKLFGGRDHTTVVSGIDAHIERAAGVRPSPFVWTHQAVRRYSRMLVDGKTVEAADRAMGLGLTDRWRCPRRRELMRQAMGLSRQRLVLAALRRKGEARP